MQYAKIYTKHVLTLNCGANKNGKRGWIWPNWRNVDTFSEPISVLFVSNSWLQNIASVKVGAKANLESILVKSFALCLSSISS